MSKLMRIYMCNGWRERGDDPYLQVGSTELNVRVEFSFTIGPNRAPADFEILEIVGRS